MISGLMLERKLIRNNVPPTSGVRASTIVIVVFDYEKVKNYGVMLAFNGILSILI
jgi:hypothetical protein